MTAMEFTKKDMQYSLIGKPLTDALQIIIRNKLDYRVLEKDTVFNAMFVPDRINVVVNEKRQVEDAYIG